MMDSPFQDTETLPPKQRPLRVHASATIAANRVLCREHFELTLRVADGFPATDAGQFIQLGCADPDVASALSLDEAMVETDWTDGRFPSIVGDELCGPLAFLRRPFSLAGRADHADGSVELRVIHRVVGRGTDWLSRLNVGDRIDLVGAMGNRFTVPRQGPSILVGGGVGIPPMLYLADLLHRSNATARAMAICGATTRSLFPLTAVDGATPTIAEFSRLGVRSMITTDDGSIGTKGFVTHALTTHLDALDLTNEANRPTIYTCGPEAMMKRVADIALERGLAVQVAVERAMACGMGTCQSCCIRVRSPQSPDGWRYALACTEGPVFGGDQLLW